MRGDPEIGDKDNTKNEKAQISAKKIAHTERFFFFYLPLGYNL
jgi:hypothetical protein